MRSTSCLLSPIQDECRYALDVLLAESQDGISHLRNASSASLATMPAISTLTTSSLAQLSCSLFFDFHIGPSASVRGTAARSCLQPCAIDLASRNFSKRMGHIRKTRFQMGHISCCKICTYRAFLRGSRDSMKPREVDFCLMEFAAS